MVISNFPEWNETGTEPDQTKKDEGWQAGEKPSADWFNWLFGRNYLSLQELDNFIEQLNTDFTDHSARHENGGEDELDLSSLADSKSLKYTSKENPNYLEKIKSLLNIKGMYIRTNGGSLFVGIGLEDDLNSVIEYRFDYNNDDLLLLRGGYTGYEDTDRSIDYGRPSVTITGDFNTKTPLYTYTTTVGDYFEFEFTGRNLYFTRRMEDRGGIWEFQLDNGKTERITCYSDTIDVLHEDKVFSNLPFDTYKCRATFKGEDPINTPTDTARGYLVYDTTSGEYPIRVGDVRPIDTSNMREIVSPNSIADFAISAKSEGATYDSEWVPSHSGITGVSTNVINKIIVDGELLSQVKGELPTLDTNYREINSFLLSQNFDAENPNGPDILWEHKINHIINKNKPYLTIQNYIDVLANTKIGLMYFGMLPSEQSVSNRLKLNNGVQYSPLPTDGSEETFGYDVTGCIFTGEIEPGDYDGVLLNVESLKETTNYGDTLQPETPGRITFRSDGVCKVYFNAIEPNSVINAGDKFTCQNSIAIITGVRSPNYNIDTI